MKTIQFNDRQKITKTKPSHINEIKEIYDKRCQKERGPLYEYASNIDFSDFATLKIFYKKNPEMKEFHKDHCNKQKIPTKNTDEVKTAFIKANTPWKCRQLGGAWDKNALSRGNFRMRGVCFVNESDKKCSKFDCESQIKYYRRGELKPPFAEISGCKVKCRDGCQFQKSGECVSATTMKAYWNKKRNEATRKIQKQGRVMLMRTKLKGFAERQKRERAAKKIQRQARIALLRRELRRRAQNTNAKRQRNISIKSKAARKIQNVYRKHLYRKNRLPNNWPNDLGKTTTKNYLTQYYNKSKSQWPIKTTKLIGKGNQCSGNQENLFSVPQAMMHSIARGIQKGSNRGMLAWHSTGSGKTCTAAAIMDAFWNTDKNIVFVTSIEAKSSNPPHKFKTCINKFLKRNISTQQMSRRVKYFSFASLAHYLQLHRPSGPKSESKQRSTLLNNAVLIIDEVQNLLKPLPQQVQEHKKLFKFLKTNETKTKSLNTFILTATPGETAKDVVDLLNLVRDRKHSEIKVPNAENMNEFKQKVQGIVQYYNTNNDLSRFPKVIHNDVYKCNMSDAQYKEYKRAYQEDLLKKSEYPSNKYFALSRKYSGLMYKRDGLSLNDFSCKLSKMVSIIKKHKKEKHWIYSAFYENRGYGLGVMGIKNVLESEPGLEYEMMSPVMARKMMSGKMKMTKKKRFCIVTTTMMKKPSEDLEDLLSVYNHDKNVNGEICQIMLASQKYNEGVDLKAVRHIHLFEPTLTEAMRQQAIGRARRNCSHVQFKDQSDWNVQIHEYDSVRIKKEKNRPNFTKTLANYNAIQSAIQKNINNIKGIRGVSNKRDKLKAELSNIKKKIRNMQKENVSYNIDSNTNDVKYIDEKVREMSKTYSGGVLENMLNIMKNSSVDCKIMKRFHNDKSITC